MMWLRECIYYSNRGGNEKKKQQIEEIQYNSALYFMSLFELITVTPIENILK